jgi:uncharacterized protein (DUF1800 family)
MPTLDAAIALHRFGTGARPGDLARVADDPRAWLRAQYADPAAFRLRGDDLPDAEEAGGVLRAYLEQRMEDGRGPRRRDGGDGDGGAAPPARAPDGRALRALAARDFGGLAAHALATPHGGAERLAWFWSNHFTVSATKPTVVPFLGLHAREGVRAHLAGDLGDLVVGAVLHPAMLLYLDQAQSIGPSTRIGRRRGRGLNENLAREVLELHTLGVDGGYTQADVLELAKALTGWTLVAGPLRRLAPDAPAGRAVFLEALHEPGARTVLGRRYPDDGAAQAPAILRDLARHPATARHLARKFCVHLLADAPPPAAIDALARAFLDADGHLPRMHAALLALPGAWTAPAAKVKPPFDFMVSALRMADVASPDTRAWAASLQLLAQPPGRAPSPAGWPDEAEAWAGPDALMKRIEWSQLLARRLDPRIDPAARAADVLGPRLPPTTRQAIARAGSAAQGWVLALMSPDFQRR